MVEEMRLLAVPEPVALESAAIAGAQQAPQHPLAQGAAEEEGLREASHGPERTKRKQRPPQSAHASPPMMSFRRATRPFVTSTNAMPSISLEALPSAAEGQFAVGPARFPELRVHVAVLRPQGGEAAQPVSPAK